MEKEKLAQNLVIKFKFFFLIFIFNCNIGFPQKSNLFVPSLKNGKKNISETIENEINRTFGLGAGVFRFHVNYLGVVDSIVISKSTLGEKNDSNQIFALKKLEFNPFNKNKKNVWFQVKIYHSTVTHQSSQFLKGLTESMILIFNQEKNDYFNKNGIMKNYIFNNGLILLQPIWFSTIE